MRTIKYWYCPNCREELLVSRVTYQEKCDACGHPVVWVEGIDPNRITEICHAEREGRCVVLPVKQYTTVYYIADNRVYTGWYLAKVGDTTHLVCTDKTELGVCWVSDDHWFLDKAEAEKALKERKENG